MQRERKSFSRITVDLDFSLSSFSFNYVCTSPMRVSEGRNAGPPSNVARGRAPFYLRSHDKAKWQIRTKTSKEFHRKQKISHQIEIKALFGPKCPWYTIDRTVASRLPSHLWFIEPLAYRFHHSTNDFSFTLNSVFLLRFKVFAHTFLASLITNHATSKLF